MRKIAIVHFVNYKKGTQTRGCMKSVMQYVAQKNKTLWNGVQLISGIGCQPETAFDEFLSTKHLHHKDGGVMFYHMVQSFPKGVAIDPRTKRHGGLPGISRAAKSSSAPTPTANTFTRTASSTASILRPARKSTWQTSRSRRCAFVMIKSARNSDFQNSRRTSSGNQVGCLTRNIIQQPRARAGSWS